MASIIFNKRGLHSRIGKSVRSIGENGDTSIGGRGGICCIRNPYAPCAYEVFIDLGAGDGFPQLLHLGWVSLGQPNRKIHFQLHGVSCIRDTLYHKTNECYKYSLDFKETNLILKHLYHVWNFVLDDLSVFEVVSPKYKVDRRIRYILDRE